ncbi:MAG: 2-hydroxyglutaryl-CoA dehydratase [Armatimonadetes bacterium]|nr:2-hydroxyglutaryl-CoA dehydratase [Armatimonadota bacterium]
MLTAGIDVGSLTAKAVVWDHAAGQVRGQSLLRLAHDPAAAGRLALDEALQQVGLAATDLTATTGTGYGRIALESVDYRITEISCHARGVHHVLPQAHTVIDIGGQDSKVMVLDDGGRALDFEMNDRCAAGTGRFLEVMAGALGTDLSGLSELALAATAPASLSSTCTVFAESEVIGLLAQGRDRADLAAGLCLAVAQRVVAMTQRLSLQPQVALTGGVALNEAVREALQGLLGRPIAVPADPQLTGALGAALLAAERKIAER